MMIASGTRQLFQLALRRDRIMLTGWVYLVTVLVASNSYGLTKLYPTAASRAQLAATGGHNPALTFLYGRMYGDSIGALSAWRYGVWAVIFAALMSVFLVIRHTRADEETGRLELIRSAAVGRQAPLTSAVVVAVMANTVLFVLLTVLLAAIGLPAGGSVAFALSITAGSLCFVFIAAVAAQFASGARAARGIVFGVLGAAYLLRAVGDSAGVGGPSWLTWVSPLGWAGFVRLYAGDRWWVLALPAALTAVACAAAYRLAAGARLRRGAAAGQAGPRHRVRVAARPGRPGLAVAARLPARLGGRHRLHLRRRPRRGRPAHGGRRDRQEGRGGPEQVQDGQALRGRHHRYQPDRRAQAGADRRRGPARRDLRHPHPAPRRRPRCRRHRGRLQELEICRARLPAHQVRRPRPAPRLPPPRKARQRARADLHARRLPHLALRQAWAPLTYTDEEPPAPVSPVAPAKRSASAQAKASRQHDENGRPYRSFQGLLAHLGTLTRNELRFPATPATVPILAEPTSEQRQAFELIGTPIPLSLRK